MKSLTLRVAVVVLTGWFLLMPIAGQAKAVARPSKSGPTLLKASIIVRANRLVRYWKAPEADNYWSWMPEVSFYVLGPVATGSAFVIDFTTETGTPWYSVECETNTVEAGRFGKIGTPAITAQPTTFTCRSLPGSQLTQGDSPLNMSSDSRDR